MPQTSETSQPTRLRLARYHCLLEELLHEGGVGAVTSREIASQLGVTEQSVRSDLSHVEIKGRPGAGYDVAVLHEALAAFLGLSEVSPFLVVGSLPMLEALPIVFPAAEFGMRPVAYFSEREQDVGCEVGGIEVQALTEIAAFRCEQDNFVVLVACAPTYIDEVLAALSSSGIRGVLMLTPQIRPLHPEDMQVTYFRIPCALKALVASSNSAEWPASTAHSCCGESDVPTA